MKLNPFKKEQYDKGFLKGQAEKEKELIPQHRKDMQELSDEKDLKIAELSAELHSMQRRYTFMSDIYEKVTKEKVQLKMDRKELQKVAEDMFYFIDQKFIDNENLLSGMGQILSKFTGKQLEGSK